MPTDNFNKILGDAISSFKEYQENAKNFNKTLEDDMSSFKEYQENTYNNPFMSSYSNPFMSGTRDYSSYLNPMMPRFSEEMKNYCVYVDNNKKEYKEFLDSIDKDDELYTDVIERKKAYKKYKKLAIEYANDIARTFSLNPLNSWMIQKVLPNGEIINIANISINNSLAEAYNEFIAYDMKIYKVMMSRKENNKEK